MALNYDNFRALGTRLITENGVPCEVVREESGGYDPLTDTDAATIVRHPSNIVLLKLRQSSDSYDIEALRATYEIGELSKGLISAGDLPPGFTPAPNDRVVIGVDTWVVKGVAPVRPDNENVLHTLYLTRGAA